jgi:hypothetical protein
VYVLYGWEDEPSLGRKKRKRNVPWKGEIVVMHNRNLEKHFGPTFSSFFSSNNFFQSMQESNDADHHHHPPEEPSE